MRFYYSFIIYLCIVSSIHSQNTKDSFLEIEYNKLENSTLEYNCKVEKIQRLLESEKNRNNPITISYLYNEFGKFNFRNKDYKNAIQNTQKALQIQKKFIDTIPFAVNKSYNNLAYMYLYSGNRTEALKTFKTLIKQPYKDRYTIMAYTIGLNNLYIEQGDYYKAINYLNEVENSIKQSNDSILNKEKYRVYLSFSRVFSETMKKEHYAKAIEYLKKTEESILHLPKKLKTKNQIIIYARYGYIYDKIKQYEKAIDYYKKALTLSLHTNPKSKHDIATTYNALGYINAKLGKDLSAFENYQNAKQYDSLRTAIYDNLGDYYLKKQDHENALKNYQKAIFYGIDQYDNFDLKKLPSIKKLTQSYNKVNLVNDLKDKSNAWLNFFLKANNKEYLKNALETITLADRLIDIIRLESTEQQSKYFWREKGIDLYMLATSICYELQDVKKAFFFMEKSKSLSLLENLTHEEAKKRGKLPEYLQEEEYNLKHKIHETIELQKIDTLLSELEKQSLLFKHKKKYENFISSLEKEYPEYFQYKKEIAISSFNESYSKITSSSTDLIQYIITENEGYGIYLNKEGTHFFKIPNIKQLLNEIRSIHELSTKPLSTKLQLDTFSKTSNSIYKKLFPFDTTSTLLKNKKLLIIPDYILQKFPFEILLTSPILKENKIPYLIYSTEISYAYSMSLLKKIEQKKRNPTSNLLALAPIHFKKHKLTSLNRSEYKMKEIQKLFPGKILYKEKAIKSNFVNNANSYNIIHLSTHANSTNNQEPWIVFYDKKITLNELYFIKNQADLIVLDACETSTGDIQPGEGVMSLSRGFFQSGSKSVVSSLWNTNEKSSSEIILDFYKNLKKGKTKSEALRQAKLRYLKKHQLSENSPYFWAPLILTGSTENLIASANDSNHSSLYWSILLLITLVIGSSIWYYYKS